MGFYIQLYSLREAARQDFKGMLERVAKIGYAGVEFAGYGGLSGEEMAALLKRLGLEAPSSHIGAGRLDADFEGEAAFLKAIGAKYAVLPYYEIKTDEDALAAAELFERYALAFQEHGIIFAYHNHFNEFEKGESG